VKPTDRGSTASDGKRHRHRRGSTSSPSVAARVLPPDDGDRPLQAHWYASRFDLPLSLLPLCFVRHGGAPWTSPLVYTRNTHWSIHLDRSHEPINGTGT
jgi:hypothetical protein